MKKISHLNTAVIHGRPSGHPTHAKYATSVNGQFFHEDHYLRWQDLKVSKVRRYLSWIINAFLFPQRYKWDIYLAEGVRVPQLIQKKLRLLRKNQKLIALMSDESLYFTYSKRFPPMTQLLMKQFWKSCDAIICVGEYQYDLAKSLLPISHHPKLYKIFNGVPAEKISELNKVIPKFGSNTIVFIGNASSIWRTEYKGLDLMIEAVSQCMDFKEIKFIIAGDIPKEIELKLLENIPSKKAKNFDFIGKIEDLVNVFNQAELYLHTARGEAWGISINEALAAGIPTIISNQTGAKEIVNLVSTDLVVNLNVSDIKNQILAELNKSTSEKVVRSKKCKEISNQYSEEEAIVRFKETFDKILNSFD